MTTDRSFKAMGCRARVVVVGSDDEALASRAIERVEELEGRWSRFRPDSEISVLNQAGGALTIVSADTFALIERAIEAYYATAGRFDPTMLEELVAQGYDRTHDHLDPPRAPAGAVTVRSPHDARRQPRGDEITLMPTLTAVQLAHGLAIDPGGIGKGLAADMVAGELVERGADGAMVDLGGDLSVRGDHPDGGPVWTVTIDDPCSPGDERFRVGITDGAIATSSQVLRRWATGAGDRHHLLDPRTGEPTDSAVASAVVAADEAWRAEVLAKAALIAGFDEGADLISGSQAVGVLFDFEGGSYDVGLLEAAEAV